MYLVHWLLAAALLVVATAAPSASDADVAWQNFKLNHGKQYRSLVEESLRKEIFVKNFNKVDAHNKLYEEGLVSYSLNINRFADLTSEEMKRMNGYRKNKVGARSIDSIQFVPDPNAQIPSEFDWRGKGAVTDVKDQGYCGSCWAFSSTGALEGQYFLKTGKLVSMSEQNLVDCSTSEGNAGCDGGDMYPAYAYVYKQDGLDSEESYPYEAVDSSCRYNVAGNVTSLKGFGSIEMGNEEHLKAAIATVGPIAVAIDASHNDFGLYSGGVYYNAQCYTANEDLDHAVLAVGYGTENGQDYWLVKNSWGTDWGEAGYIKMARNKDNNCGIATEGVYPLNY